MCMMAVLMASAAFVSGGDGTLLWERFDNPRGQYSLTNRVGDVVIEMDSAYPNEPWIGFRLVEKGDLKTLRVKIPDWVTLGENGSVRVDGEELRTSDADGYVTIQKEWKPQDRVIVGLMNRARRVPVGNGRVEVRRGEESYVSEGEDLADDVTFSVRILHEGGVAWQVLDASDGRVFYPLSMGRKGTQNFRRLAAKPKVELPLETSRLQAQIDAVAASGGGRVTIGPGVHKSGTLYLKSHVELHLEKGAVLLASEKLEDYNDLDAFPQNGRDFSGEGWQAKHLIVCLEQEDVSITGEGTIDGNGRAFFEDSMFACFGHGCWKRTGGINSRDRRNAVRPGQLVEFCESRNLRVSGISFVDSPAWTLFFHGCDDVAVDGLRIESDLRHMNTDGIDIDACRRVRVRNCSIRTGDDAIAIRCDLRRLKDKARACEDVVIENVDACVSCCGCRLGVGDGTIRKVRISDFRVARAGYGIWVQSAYRGIGSVDISDVKVSRATLSDTMIAVNIVGSNGRRPHDIVFDDVAVDCNGRAPDEMVRVVHADRVSLDGIRCR